MHEIPLPYTRVCLNSEHPHLGENKYFKFVWPLSFSSSWVANVFNGQLIIVVPSQQGKQIYSFCFLSLFSWLHLVHLTSVEVKESACNINIVKKTVRMTQKQPKRNQNWKIRKTTTIQLGWKAFIENNKRSKHWHNCEFIHKRSLLYSPRKECTWWMRSTWCTATVAPDQANFPWSGQASKVTNLIG